MSTSSPSFVAAVEDCRDASLRLRSLCQGAEILFDQIQTDLSATAEAVSALLAVLVQASDKLNSDLDAALMVRDEACRPLVGLQPT